MIILVRHAAAVDEGPDLRDEHRYLTRAGRAAAVALAAEMRAGQIAVTQVLTSPLVRAVQTAELIAHALGLELVIEATALLAPGGSIRLAAARLAGASGTVMAVGHEPSISALAGTLTFNSSFPSLRKAEAAVVEGDALRAWLGSDRRGKQGILPPGDGV